MISDEIRHRNCSIDIFRYICAVMIIAIHTHPFSEFGANAGYIFTQIVPRIAVPFFFLTSGYFYFVKMETGSMPFLPYIKRLLITYSVWSLIYLPEAFIASKGTEPTNFIVKYIISFFISGSYYHLWFFPALIFSVCLSTLMLRLKLQKAVILLGIILYVIGCFGCSYYEIGINISVIGRLFIIPHFTVIRRILFMGFPFFTAGLLIRKLEKLLHRIPDKFLILSWTVSFAVWIAEIYLVITFKVQDNIIITFGLYVFTVSTFLLLLRYPMYRFKKSSQICRSLSGFTYYSHPIFIAGMSIVYFPVMTPTLMFLLTAIFTLLCGMLIIKLNNPILNHLLK